MALRRRSPAPAAGPLGPPSVKRQADRGGVARKARSSIDRLTDALGPTATRERVAKLKRITGITRYGGAALVGFVVLWLMARIIAGTAIYLFAYGILLLVVVCYFLAPRRLKLEGDRTGLYPRAREGDRFDVVLSLTAKRRISTFVLEERVPERLGKPVRVPVTKLANGATLEHSYGLRCARRGVYQVGPLVAIAGDPLGLAERETVVAEPFELLVHPRVDDADDRPLTRAFEEPPVRPPVSKPWPSGLELYGIREYAPGDDVRRIVWRATARTGKVMVRESEQGVTDRVVMMLDTDRGGHSRDGEGLSESFEAAIRVAASIGTKHLKDGYEVTIQTNGGPLTRPQRGILQQTPLLDALARLEMGREPLTKMLLRLLSSPAGAASSHNILVTPRLGPVEAAQLKVLVNTGASVLVVALLWDEDSAALMGTAASLGCQVVGLRPGQDVRSALYGGGIAMAGMR